MPSYIELDAQDTYPSASAAGKYVFEITTGGTAVLIDNNGNVTNLASGVTNTNRVINNANDGQTLNTTDYILFCNIDNPASATVYLPDVVVMQGKQLIFISISDSYEFSFVINVNQSDGSNINYHGGTTTFFSFGTLGQTVTLVSDGTNWWVVNSEGILQ